MFIVSDLENYDVVDNATLNYVTNSITDWAVKDTMDVDAITEADKDNDDNAVDCSFIDEILKSIQDIPDNPILNTIQDNEILDSIQDNLELFFQHNNQGTAEIANVVSINHGTDVVSTTQVTKRSMFISKYASKYGIYFEEFNIYEFNQFMTAHSKNVTRSEDDFFNFFDLKIKTKSNIKTTITQDTLMELDHFGFEAYAISYSSLIPNLESEPTRDEIIDNLKHLSESQYSTQEQVHRLEAQERYLVHVEKGQFDMEIVSLQYTFTIRASKQHVFFIETGEFPVNLVAKPGICNRFNTSMDIFKCRKEINTEYNLQNYGISPLYVLESRNLPKIQGFNAHPVVSPVGMSFAKILFGHYIYKLIIGDFKNDINYFFTKMYFDLDFLKLFNCLSKNTKPSGIPIYDDFMYVLMRK